MIRTIFKNLIAFLAKTAIKKHQMTIYVVSGWYGTEITREFVYSSLNTKFNVRRNLKNPWWDMSYPLAILGYNDETRNVFEWLSLIFRVALRLMFGKKHKHNIVLNINYSKPHSIKYWDSFIKPSYLVITSYKKNYDFIDKLIKSTIKNKGKIIYSRKDKDILKNIFGNYQKTYSFGKNDAKCDLLISETESNTTFECMKEKISIKKMVLPGVSNEIIAGSLLLGKIKNINMSDSLYSIIKVGLPQRLLYQIKADLNK
jgi:hypothetical protein